MLPNFFQKYIATIMPIPIRVLTSSGAIIHKAAAKVINLSTVLSFLTKKPITVQDKAKEPAKITSIETMVQRMFESSNNKAGLYTKAKGIKKAIEAKVKA